jgi:hypothetical protein
VPLLVKIYKLLINELHGLLEETKVQQEGEYEEEEYDDEDDEEDSSAIDDENKVN